MPLLLGFQILTNSVNRTPLLLKRGSCLPAKAMAQAGGLAGQVLPHTQMK
jgi:hypothetical protein